MRISLCSWRISLLGDSPFILVWSLFLYILEKPEKAVKKRGEAGKCERYSDLQILHNLFGEIGKIIWGTSGNLGKDKDCENLVI